MSDGTDETAVGDSGGTAAPGAREAVPLSLVAPDELDACLAGLPETQAAWARANGFDGKLGSHLPLPAADGGIDRVVRAPGTVQRAARDHRDQSATQRTAKPHPVTEPRKIAVSL